MVILRFNHLVDGLQQHRTNSTNFFGTNNKGRRYAQTIGGKQKPIGYHACFYCCMANALAQFGRFKLNCQQQSAAVNGLIAG